jgi:hypothetical protein
MADQSSFQKAQLAIEGQGEPLKCRFNPEQYSISKTNEWRATPVVGSSLPAMQFAGGLGRELSLELLFDASESSSGDVRSVTDRLFLMMEATQAASEGRNSARPPTVTFSWGETVTFTAICRDLGVRFTLFRADGTPVRAFAALTLVQVERADSRSGSGTPPAQNPSTRASSGHSIRVLQDGDSLQSLAYAAYGDPTRWRAIAEANDIDDPQRLSPGEPLLIPDVLSI